MRSDSWPVSGCRSRSRRTCRINRNDPPSSLVLVHMSIATRKPLRLWPGVVIAILLGLARFVVPVVVPDFMMYGVLGGFAGGALVFVWWLLFSRAVWFERLGAIALSA